MLPPCNAEYGRHLSLYAHVEAGPSTLADPTRVSQFLTDLVATIGMTILAGPISGFESGDPATEGCSAVVILHESHAAIHTYSLLSTVFLDVFSCRPFDCDDVLDALSDAFGAVRCDEFKMTSRGAHWTNDVAAALAAWRTAR